MGKDIVKTYNNLEEICIDYSVLEAIILVLHIHYHAVANVLVIIIKK